jgi:hypothetical protein
VRRADVVVVGAGPAGLATVVALADAVPGADVLVVDPAGGWLDTWDRQFAWQDIAHLRSAAVHHPHQRPFELYEHAREDELVRRGQHRLPTTAGFRRFCDLLVDRAHPGPVLPARATGLRPDGDGVLVGLAGADAPPVIRARRVVVATNHRRPATPPWVAAAPGRVRHAGAVDVRQVCPGRRVLVVGGGISAAHLVVGAVERGAEVVHVVRRRLRQRPFDTDPGWLGPRQLAGFHAEHDRARRRRLVDVARDGGSVPSWLVRRMDEAVAAGGVVRHEGTEVVGVAAVASSRGPAGAVEVTLGGAVDGRVRVDEVWCATGAVVDVTCDPLVAPLLDRTAAGVHAGMPTLDDDLSLPGTRVHLHGGGAALVLGPVAGNLVGHRRAAALTCAAVHRDLAGPGSAAPLLPGGVGARRPARVRATVGQPPA